MWLLILAALAAGIVLLALRWRELGFRWNEFVATFRHLDWPWVALGMAFALFTYFGRALRWQVLLRGVKTGASLWRITVATAIGFTALVIFGRAGELVRPYLIAVKEKVPFSSQVAAWLLERIYDLLTALLIFGFALGRVQSSGMEVGQYMTWVLRVGGWVAGIAGAISLGVLVLFSRYAVAMERRLLEALTFLPEATYDRVSKMVAAFRQGIESNRRRSSVYLIVFYSLLEWALIIAAYGCIFRASPATTGLSPTDIVIFVGFVAFGAVVQVPGIGGGIQVVSVIVLTELFGLSLAAASGVALMLWVVTFVSIVPIGLLAAFHEGLNWQKLRKIEEDAHL